jgi:hypothetical protein
LKTVTSSTNSQGSRHHQPTTQRTSFRNNGPRPSPLFLRPRAADSAREHCAGSCERCYWFREMRCAEPCERAELLVRRAPNPTQLAFSRRVPSACPPHVDRKDPRSRVPDQRCKRYIRDANPGDECRVGRGWAILVCSPMSPSLVSVEHRIAFAVKEPSLDAALALALARSLVPSLAPLHPLSLTSVSWCWRYVNLFVWLVS